MKILFWLNTARNTLYCRITVCGLRAEISTGIRIQDPSLWDSVRQTMRGDKAANYKLTEMKLFFLREEILRTHFTVETMKQAWMKKQPQAAKPVPRLLDIIPDSDGGYKGLIKHLDDNPGLDMLNQESPGPHIRGDVLKLLDMGWDLMI